MFEKILLSFGVVLPTDFEQFPYNFTDNFIIYRGDSDQDRPNL